MSRVSSDLTNLLVGLKKKKEKSLQKYVLHEKAKQTCKVALQLHVLLLHLHKTNKDYIL